MTRPPVGLSGIVGGPHDLLARGLCRAAASSPIVLPVTVSAPPWSRWLRPGACRRAARRPPVQVGRDVRAARLQVGDQRRALARSRSKSSMLERHARFVGDAPAGAAPRWSSRRWRRRRRSRSRSASRVRMSRGRTPRCSRSIDQLAGARARPRPCLGSAAGTLALPNGGTPRNSHAIAIVLAVNWPPQAPAPGQAWSSSSRSSRVAHLAGRVRADRLEHVLDGDVAGPEVPGAIEPP